MTKLLKKLKANCSGANLSTWTNGSSNSSLVNKSVCRFRGKFEAVEKVQKKVERIPDLEIDKVNVLFCALSKCPKN